MKKRLSLSLLVALMPSLSGCFLVPCTGELAIDLEPKAVTLAVGESTTPSIELYGCGGRERVQDTFIWTSKDPKVASVDRITGTITALSGGQTDIEVRGEELGPLGVVTVIVTAVQ